MKLNLNSVSKKYKTDVIKNVSYTFESGKMYVIKGVSGCGKTTLLNIIGGRSDTFFIALCSYPIFPSSTICF